MHPMWKWTTCSSRLVWQHQARSWGPRWGHSLQWRGNMLERLLGSTPSPGSPSSSPPQQLDHGTWATLLRGCENHFLLGGRGNVTKGFLRDPHCSWRALGAPARTNLLPLGWQSGARADGVSLQTRAGLEEAEEQTQTPCRPSIVASNR